ncbi:MAG: hypothetical protein K2X82_30875 [Gemmataceae bacterium]|nr:hypothetical protein [Gemmataceae bacterium]
MFHDDRTWCVRPEGTPEAVAMQVTRRTWPACTAFAVGDYLFLNDSLPEDGSTDYAVVKRPTEPGGRFVQVASLTLGFWSYENALDLIRSVLAGDYDAPASTFAVDPHLEPAPAHVARCCPYCS